MSAPPTLLHPTPCYYHAACTIVSLRYHHAALSLRCVVITLHYCCTVGFIKQMPVHGVVSGLDDQALWEAASHTKTQNVDNVSLYKHPFNSNRVTLGQNCTDFAEAVLQPGYLISIADPKTPGHMENFMISGSALPNMKPLGWLKGDYFLIHIPDGAIS